MVVLHSLECDDGGGGGVQKPEGGSHEREELVCTISGERRESVRIHRLKKTRSRGPHACGMAEKTRLVLTSNAPPTSRVRRSGRCDPWWRSLCLGEQSVGCMSLLHFYHLVLSKTKYIVFTYIFGVRESLWRIIRDVLVLHGI